MFGVSGPLRTLADDGTRGWVVAACTQAIQHGRDYAENVRILGHRRTVFPRCSCHVRRKWSPSGGLRVRWGMQLALLLSCESVHDDVRNTRLRVLLRRRHRMRRFAPCCTVAVLLSATLAPSAAPQEAPLTVSLIDTDYVRIGAMDGPPEYTFSGIVAAFVTSTGQVVVADGGNHIIHLFDSKGSHVRSVGREGAGPGEFQGLWWIGVCPDGAAIAIDAVLGRGTLLPENITRIDTTIALPAGLLFNRYLSCQPSRRLLVLLNRPRVLGEKGKVSRFPSYVVQVELESQQQDTLAQLPGTDFYFAERVGGYAPLPLGAQALAAVGSNRLYLAQNTADEIATINLTTGHRRTFRHGLTARRTTARDWTRAKNEFVGQAPQAQTRRLLQNVLAEAPMPELHPGIIGMHADRSGRLWVRPASSNPEVGWRVFSAEGRHIGTVYLDSTLEPVDIGVKHLLAVERDSLDVQRLRYYRFADPLL